jgi:adenylate cyclase
MLLLRTCGNFFILDNFALIHENQKLMAADHKPAPEAIRAQLERILHCAEFRGSYKQREFLGFVVDETLEDRTSQLKGYTIAVAVYGRKEGFDPQVDPIVRVEAGRLRRALEHYYLTAGKNDPIHIEIPKGGYVPTFHAVQNLSTRAKTRTSENEDSALPTGTSIAVMPLTNLAGDEAQDYFADGLTEELTVELARFQEFQVIASQSTMRFKGQKVDPKKVGRDLGVRFVLMGSIRKDLEIIKVTIRLLDTATAGQIWGESYKRDQTAADLIAVQEEIAHRVVGAIADQYGLITRRLSRESRKKAPADLKVYDAILRFYHYESELTPQAFEKALAALERAIDIDPEYGLAWAMLGHLHADNHALGFCEIEAPLEKALTFAQKGVALEPDSQFVQDALTLVHFHRGDKEHFLKHVAQTIALNPNSPYVVGVAGWHMALYGEWERGLKLMKKGMKLNPYHPSWFHLAPYMDFYCRGEYENAFAEALKFNYPEMFWDPLMRTAALSQMDRAREAKTAVGELLKLEPDFTARGRRLISRYVKVDDLVDMIIEGLRKAGLADIE